MACQSILMFSGVLPLQPILPFSIPMSKLESENLTSGTIVFPAGISISIGSGVVRSILVLITKVHGNSVEMVAYALSPSISCIGDLGVSTLLVNSSSGVISIDAFDCSMLVIEIFQGTSLPLLSLIR